VSRYDEYRIGRWSIASGRGRSIANGQLLWLGYRGADGDEISPERV